MEYWLQSAADAGAGERSRKHCTRPCPTVHADDAAGCGCGVNLQKEGLHRVWLQSAVAKATAGKRSLPPLP